MVFRVIRDKIQSNGTQAELRYVEILEIIHSQTANTVTCLKTGTTSVESECTAAGLTNRPSA